MKIDSIKISNVLSFKHFDELSQCEEIKFDSSDENFHILIGPNGSGKSCFLEILNQLFKNTLFKRCTLNKNIFENRSNDVNYERNKKSILQISDLSPAYLNKNWDCLDKPQKILLSVTLNQNDYDNIYFIVDNSEVIDEYLRSYSYIGISFTNFFTHTDVHSFKNNIKNQTLSITFSRANEGEKLIINVDAPNNEKMFIKQYLEYFEVLQNIIEIHNAQESGNTWKPLKNTFLLIGCYRNYHAINPNYETNQDEGAALINIINQYKNTTTMLSSNDEPDVFKLVKHKLAYSGRRILVDKGKETAIARIRSQPLYKDINNLLKKFLGLELVIDFPRELENTWSFAFHINKGNKTINFQNLSAGQKGIIHLIFALYGYDIENGLIIIDEPELHLHPQLQRKYVEISQQESKNRDIQFIIATHSPVFVSEKTIANVKRFYFDEDEKTSKVVQAKITEEQKFLIKILSYTNASKIFFVDRAILVEGPSDEYFWNFYINYLNDKKIFECASGFEVYSIEGKYSYKNWKEFLDKWKLKVSFICDWDNVENFDLVRGDAEVYKQDQSKKSELNDKIDIKYGEGIYIMKKGALEDYLGVQGKNISKVIEFCNMFVETNLKHKEELEGIVKQIFTQCR